MATSISARRALVWFRDDLRVFDNCALHYASTAATEGVVGVFLVSREQWLKHDWGDVKVDFLLRNVKALSTALAKYNIPLRIVDVPLFSGAPQALLNLAREHGCDLLAFNKEYELNEARRDAAVTELFAKEKIRCESYHDQTIVPPDAVFTQQGRFYSVFTPYRRAWLNYLGERLPIQLRPPPRRQIDLGIKSDAVPEQSSPVPASMWIAGEEEAMRRLKAFTADRITDYKELRDVPDLEATSQLSPYLSVGSLSPRQCFQVAMNANKGRIETGNPGAVHWMSELVWREFYRAVLVGWPHVCMNKPFKLETTHLKWRNDPDEFKAWTEGRTGVPIVDAGIRQLLATGFMHNRARMIVAQYLTKHLLIDWRWGEKFFSLKLIDSDLAQNNGGWQWCASTGTDAAPYFRVFNPITQSEKNDPLGRYIRKWVPELADIDNGSIHNPDAATRTKHGYPKQLVDLSLGRDRAIEAFKNLPKTKAPAAGY